MGKHNKKPALWQVMGNENRCRGEKWRFGKVFRLKTSIE
jgi:hypothetical protein